MPDELPPTLRAFVAAALPAELADKVAQVQRSLARVVQSNDVRWIRSEQIHLTLKFLGNVSATDLPSLHASIQRAASSVRCITLTVGGYGCFPSDRRPSVIWLGLGGELEALSELQRRIDHETAAFCTHSESRQFHPHLTLGRVRTPGAGVRRIGEVIRAQRAESIGEWTIREVLLVRSQLGSGGSTYTVLGAVPLA